MLVNVFFFTFLYSFFYNHENISYALMKPKRVLVQCPPLTPASKMQQTTYYL